MGTRIKCSCYVPCRSDTDGRQPTHLCSNSDGPPSATLGTPRMVHNLSRDTGDPLTSLSFLLYLLIFLMPCSDYLLRVFLMFSLIYFHSFSSGSINSSTIVGSTQTKNLVVFQFRLHANLLLFPLQLTRQLPKLPFIRLGLPLLFTSESISHCRLPLEPIGNLRPLLEITAQGHRKRVTQ